MTTQHKIGVLVVQLGTPDSPTAGAVRPYLRQFLSDRRVIDYSPFFWQPVLRGIILRVRPAKSARLYARIWTDEGSPLMVYSQRQVEGLQERLGDRYRVILGMTYGSPGIREAIDTLENEGIDRIVALSMYPQYASTTTASVYDAVYDAAGGKRGLFNYENKRFVPALRFVPPYYDDPGYIDALRMRVEETVQSASQPPQKYLFTFHGNPARYTGDGDPYREQCLVTARLLADSLNLKDEDWLVTFQSRFGPEKWLEPYTSETIEHLAAEGIERLLVVAPGFTADCLETLDELGNEAREEFAAAGGREEGFILAPCLNDHPRWLDVLAGIVRRESLGWVMPDEAGM